MNDTPHDSGVSLYKLVDRLENELGLTLFQSVRCICIVMSECSNAGVFADQATDSGEAS